MEAEPTTYMETDVSSLLAITTLSGLVRAAIDSGRRLDPARFVPMAGSWFPPRFPDAYPDDPRGRKCQVCDAGAVLAGLCGMPHRTAFAFPPRPDHPRLHDTLSALDDLRVGNWTRAAARIDVELSSEQRDALYLLERPAAPSFGHCGIDGDIRSWMDYDRHIADLDARVLPELQRLGL